MKKFGPVNEDDLLKFGRSCGVELIRDTDVLYPYVHPERGSPGRAAGLVVPKNTEELQQILRSANDSRVPLVISAGRTGLVEAQRPQDEVVLSLEKLIKPILFKIHGWQLLFEHPQSGVYSPDAYADQLYAAWQSAGTPELIGAEISVEAGLAVDALNQIIKPLNLLWPMEMGSTASASVGGAVANASAGANALHYGTAAHLCISANGYWANGASADEHFAPVWSIPATEKLAIDSSSFEETNGLIGSQGVLGVISELTVRLYPTPRQREAVLLPVEDMKSAMRIFARAREQFPATPIFVEEFEFISAAAAELVAQAKQERFRFPLPERTAPFYVLLQLASVNEDLDLAEIIYGFISENLSFPDEKIGYGPLKAIKEIRHSITESSNIAARTRGGGRLSFDTATPVDVFGEYLDELQRELMVISPDLMLVSFGHAGVGGAHLHILGSEASPVSALESRLIDCVFSVTRKFGGTFSAEHGVGPKWAQHAKLLIDSELYDSMQTLKKRFDPNCVLNRRSFGFCD